jgi:hypothetical protein
VANSITGNEIAADSITASKIDVGYLSAIAADMGTITAGNITMPASGYIKAGQTDFNTGTGFFLGYSNDAYKFSVGSPVGKGANWDGSAYVVKGVIAPTVIKVYTTAEAIYLESSGIVYTTALVYTKMKTVTFGSDWPLMPVRFRYSLQHTDSGYTAYIKLYRNNVAYGLERTAQAAFKELFSEELTYGPGDTADVYLKVDKWVTGNGASNDTFEIRGSTSPQKFTIT